MLHTQNARYSELKQKRDDQRQGPQIGTSFVTVVIIAGRVEAAAWKIPSSSIRGFDTPNNTMLTYLVDTEAGVTSAANNFYTRRINQYVGLEGLNVPHWDEIVSIASQCYQSIPMRNLHLEMCITPQGKVRLVSVDHQFDKNDENKMH